MNTSTPLVALGLCSLVTPVSSAAETAPVSPIREGGELVLFDADKHGPDVFRNYTASWKEGSDLVPVTKAVDRQGERFVEFSYEKQRGTAISLIRFEELPEPPTGMRYGGLKFVVDYDRDDYRRISVSASFSDDTNLSARLVLEQGTNECTVADGFRRAKFPPDWNRLSWIWLAVDLNQNGHNRNVVYRLKKITMLLQEAEPHALANVAFGDRVFCPQPKHVAWKTGEFPGRGPTHVYLLPNASARTKRTAEVFRNDYQRHTGTTLEVAAIDGEAPSEGIVLRVAKSVVHGGATTRLKPEGYHLAVEPRRVVITGADEPGLYYGGVTFFQLMKNSMRIEHAMPVPCVDVIDWPDLPNRMCRLEHPLQFKHGKLKEDRGIDFLIDWTERFVAGNKLNVFFIDLSANTVYRRRPECNGGQRSYTLADLERFGQFCRDRFIDLCPAWQVGGHANWWLTYGYHPELVERGFTHAQADVTHPAHDPIVFDCMLDVIEALKPKYASPKSDEWWHRRARDQRYDALLHGKTRAEAFLDFHVKLNEWLNARGITMMIYHDMITPYHNGTRFDLYKIADQMPKDVVILHWGAPDDIPKWFAGKGFCTWMNPTGMRLIPPGMESCVDGYGKAMYGFGDSRKMPSELRNTNNMYALHRGADHAWNLSRDRRGDWEGLVDSGRLIAIRNLFAVRPNPRAGEAIRPLNIRNFMNQSFAGFLGQAKPESIADRDDPVALPSGATNIGLVPTQFGPPDDNNCIVVEQGAPKVSLPIDGRFSSLVFLHTAHLRSPDGIRPTTHRQWPYGFPCGNYVVRYEDGAEVELPLRFEYNIRRFDVPAINRATNDNRYVHALEGGPGAAVHLFQWEWVNPRPNKKIVGVDVMHDNELDVSLVLLAISGRAAVAGN